MTVTYLDELKKKKFVGNVVIKINGVYFSIRQPDSGLSIDSRYAKTVASLVVNPTTVDIRRVSTTIATFSFKLTDINGEITKLVNGDASTLLGAEVEIWQGRNTAILNEGNFDFSDYRKLPITRIKKASRSDNGYTFSSAGEMDRMNKPLYQIKSRLDGDILAATTEITCEDSLATWPALGLFKVDNEFISYTGVDLVNNRLTGCVRGEYNTVPAPHTILTDLYFTEVVEDNPLTMLLEMLNSGGGGGAYDVLEDGLGISDFLVDIAGIENLRDSQFAGKTYRFFLYNISNALTFMEQQILQPTGTRFTYSDDSKITLALLDKAVFVDSVDIISHDNMTTFPKWDVDTDKIVNQIEVEWDYSEALGAYLNISKYQDDDSITKYDSRTPLKFSFGSIRTDLNGQDIVDRFSRRMLERLSTPTPEISFSTHIDQSLKNIGDKVLIQSSLIPANDGTLNFATELEIVSMSTRDNDDVQFKVQYTSFTGINSCYLAPSDLLVSIASQTQATLAAGRGDYYEAGWKVKLWSVVANEYTADATNEIISVVGDVVTFKNAWTTTLTNNNFRLKFADYDEATDSQKRYCYVSSGSSNFPDGRKPYTITY